MTIAPSNTGGEPSIRTKISTLSGKANNTTYVAEGAGTAVTYTFPSMVATNLAGTVYAADEYGPLVRKILPTGVTSILAGSAKFANGSFTEYGHVDGTGSSAKFKSPRGMVTDLLGNIFVADPYDFYIRKITPEGVVTTVAGNGISSHLSGSLKYPYAITIDKNTNNLFIVDEHRIKKITPAGIITTISGSTAGNNNGGVLSSKFRDPRGIATDSYGNIYVADSGNSAVRKIDTTLGIVTTISIPGLGVPSGALYNDENLYISDSFNHIILKIDTLSISSVFAGSGLQSAKDGFSTPNTGAGFYSPENIAIDGSGIMYVADRNNNKIRKVESFPAYTIVPALPTGIKLNAVTGVISGTPTAPSGPSTFTITASNYEGSSSTSIILKIS